MKNIAVVVGARPNFMKAAPIYNVLSSYFNITLIHTGQHYDKKMSEVFFDQLKFPRPSVHLTLDSKSRAGDYDHKLYVENDIYMEDLDMVIDDLQTYKGDLGQLGEIRDKLYIEFEQSSPDLVIVFGDVTSTLAASLAAEKLNIKIAHIESGLRSGDIKMPEEVNRILTDHITDYFFVTEQSGIDNLKSIGIVDDVYLVGNTMIDTQKKYLKQALATNYNDHLGVDAGKYVLITLHRPSNVDNIKCLREIFDDINQLSKTKKVVYPIHPRTKSKLHEIGYIQDIENNQNIILTEPLGYLEFTCLLANCEFVVTDSGGLQEESTALDVPCFTLRKNTERPSTLIENSGTNQLINKISDIKIRVCKGSMDLWDGKSSERILEVLDCQNGYGIKTVQIDKLEKIYTKGIIHYKYKDCDFLYKNNNSKYLLITFHASIPDFHSLPIFRLYDFDEKDIDVLCISDILMKYRRYNKTDINYDACFYLNCDNEHSIYEEIIRSVIVNYKKTIFFGTSAGGLPALMYASRFKVVALLGNSPLYIKDWWNIKNTQNVLETRGKHLEILDIEQYISKNGPPELLILFTNIMDEISPYKDHHEPIINFFNKNYPNNILPCYHSMKLKNKTYHTTHFAKYSYVELIKNIFKKNCNEVRRYLYNGNIVPKSSPPKVLFLSQGRSGSTYFFSQLNKEIKKVWPGHTYIDELSHLKHLEILKSDEWKNAGAIEFLTDYNFLKSKLRYNLFKKVLRYCIKNNYIIIGLFRKNHLNVLISKVYANLKWEKGLSSAYVHDDIIQDIEIPDEYFNQFPIEVKHKRKIIKMIKPNLDYFFTYEDIYQKDEPVEIDLTKKITLNLYNETLLNAQQERMKHVTNLHEVPSFISEYDYDADF